MQLCKNMNPMVFHDLVTDLRDRLSGLTNSDFKVYLENSLRMDPKRADNLEMRNGNTYPTLPLLEKPQPNGTWRHPDMEKPQAPYMETP